MRSREQPRHHSANDGQLWCRRLPAFFVKDVERLDKFSQTLRRWEATRHAVEFRHETWFEDDVAECLTKHAVAVCISDAPDWPLSSRVTTDLVYIRLHGHTRKYASNYCKPALKRWATRLQCWLKKTATCTCSLTMMLKVPRQKRTHTAGDVALIESDVIDTV